MDMDNCSLGWSKVFPTRKVIYIAQQPSFIYLRLLP